MNSPQTKPAISRAGRPRSRPCTRLTSRVEVRLTPAEHQEIKKKASASTLSLSRFLAQSAVLGKPPLTTEDREEIFRVRFLLMKAGTNLNQLTRQKNAAAIGSMIAPEPGEVESAARIVRMLSERLGKFLKE